MALSTFPRPVAGNGRQAPQLHLLIVLAVAATALALLTTAQAGIALAHHGQFVPWTGLLKARLVDWYACALFVPPLFWLARRHPVDRMNWPRTLPIHLLAAVPIAISKEAIFVAVGNIFRPDVFDLSTILAEDLGHEVIAVWGFSALAHAWAFHERYVRVPDAPASSSAAPPAVAAVDHIAVRTATGYRMVKLEDIESVDAHGNYARLVTSHGRFLVRETMSRLEQQLGPRFRRVHRRIIVRVDKVVRIEPRSHGERWLYLASGQRVASGRTYGATVRGLLRSLEAAK